MEWIRVSDVSIIAKTIAITYQVSESLAKYFNKDCATFRVEYSEDIECVPIGIAVIPFVCNVLPIVWLTDATLYLPEIDQTFYESIDDFKQGYKNMYPMLSFDGKIEADIKNYSYTADGGNAAFFSGGVDAFATLIAHRDEHPVLVTMRGADVKLDDIEGWENVYTHVCKTAMQFDLPSPVTVTSNFRTFINEGILDGLVTIPGNGWWYGFQHGIGLIGHAAPLAFLRHLECVYIASTYPIYEKNVTCASHFTIDNYVRYGSTRVLHDQVELSRQDKIKALTQFYKKGNQKINLRVCWKSQGGRNCCHCEKCIRTMFGLMAEGENPRNYGFDYCDDDLRRSEELVSGTLYNASIGSRKEWQFIKARFLAIGACKDDPRINWIYDFDPFAKRPRPSLVSRAIRRLSRLIRKFF